MDIIKRAMLGDKKAQQEITARGELLTCPCCGSKVNIMCFEKSGIPSGDMGHFAKIKCSNCWLELERWALKNKWAVESVIKSWNSRPQLLTDEEMEGIK